MDRAFLGVGWKFPPQVTPSGAIATSRAEQKIEESIYLILSTAQRERPMLPAYGCGIHDLVFAPDNPSTIAEVSASAREALITYEPRIDVLAVDVAAAPGQPNVLLIRIDYRVRANNARGNLVYPFFITEGM
ncbi:baseplate protein [Mycobacterium sp. ACS1612]|uniref:GPW/gp25 family protein n=1 Tax=Mycobacterium sp. ACS1612 TaxID=1834117 RepID=UPI0008004345|nr:GPW/gp25 family protein [Mycobacterium sp. ACS1612]OBF33691.1 baseplate protein [Mycobacterium sp. ACS1612]